ncbi:unnamed protein product [Spirodela intermedia]|uniref:Uncharacterized protein n=1 Tax=Spirodela intermedia TaxID=51605 RepID=A0A7I8K525_SPIIN|nr:unnamed protein product [Spirodela intermedia]
MVGSLFPSFAAVAVVALLHSLAVPPAYSQGNLAFLLCSGANYTADGQYESNLHRLLTEFKAVPPTADRGHYRNASVGVDGFHTAYGLFQCRGDIVAADCTVCANRSVSEAILRCPLRRGVAIIFDNCVLRYSDQRFFGAMDVGGLRSFYNVNNASDPALFDKQLMELMTDIVSLAATGSSRFAVGIKNYSSSIDIYGLVQCTRDLSASVCDECLRFLLGNLVRGGSVGGQVYAPSCTLGFEIRPYFSFSVVPPPPSLASPVEGPAPSGGTSLPIGDPGSEEKKSKPSRILVIVVIALAAAVFLLLAVVIYLLRRPMGKTFPNDPDDINEDSLQYDFRTLRTATGNFCEENKLGQGGFGPVYRGVLPDGRQIAVKRLSRGSGQGLTELRNEVVLVAKLHHRNLVRLLGFCLEEEEKMVIYEYLPNQSLDKFLFDPVKRLLLNWEKRLKLIEGIARGLVYLHEDSRLRIIHRDLKASNILLDGDMNPKISDFGLAKLFRVDETHGNTNQIAGTHGYMAPEYVFHGQFSAKSDVFSFGVLMLEIVTGRRSSGFRESEDTLDLLSHVWNHWNQGAVLQVVDQSIAAQCQTAAVMRCIHISLLCVQNDPMTRPNMSDVALMMSSFSVSLRAPSRPAFLITGSNSGMLPGDEGSEFHDNIDLQKKEAEYDVSISDFGPR